MRDERRGSGNNCLKLLNIGNCQVNRYYIDFVLDGQLHFALKFLKGTRNRCKIDFEMKIGKVVLTF